MKKYAAIIFAVLFMCACSSSNNDNVTPTGEAEVPDYASIAQQILPVLSTTASGDITPIRIAKAVDFNTEFPEDYPSIQDMIYNSLSTSDTLWGVSIFATIDMFQVMFDEIAAHGGFDSACPDSDEFTGTATKLSNGQTLTVPYIGDVAVGTDYSCLYTLADVSETTPGFSYAFGIKEDTDGNLYVANLIFAGMQSEDGGTLGSPMVGKISYDADTTELSYEQASSYETPSDHQDGGIRSSFGGTVEPNKFYFKTTSYYPPNAGEGDSTCPTETDADKTARKLKSVGNATADFIVGALRSCESATTYNFCMNGETKDIATSDTGCAGYEAEYEALEMIPIADVPHGMVNVADYPYITVK